MRSKSRFIEPSHRVDRGYHSFSSSGARPRPRLPFVEPEGYKRADRQRLHAARCLTTRKGTEIMKKKIVALTAALAVLACGSAWAAWPEDKTIEVIVGFAPGGATDVMARKLLPF